MLLTPLEMSIDIQFQRGKQAARTGEGKHNPFVQRDGELWFIANQDALYDAWERGYNSLALSKEKEPRSPWIKNAI